MNAQRSAEGPQPRVNHSRAQRQGEAELLRIEAFEILRRTKLLQHGELHRAGEKPRAVVARHLAAAIC